MKRTPLKRKSSISPVSDKLRREMRIYTQRRKAYLAKHRFCEATMRVLGIEPSSVNGETGVCHLDGRLFILPQATEIHHTKGRGRYYLDESTWLACSAQMHRAIHANGKWARENGLLV